LPGFVVNPDCCSAPAGERVQQPALDQGCSSLHPLLLLSFPSTTRFGPWLLKDLNGFHCSPTPPPLAGAQSAAHDGGAPNPKWEWVSRCEGQCGSTVIWFQIKLEIRLNRFQIKLEILMPASGSIASASPTSMNRCMIFIPGMPPHSSSVPQKPAKTSDERN